MKIVQSDLGRETARSFVNHLTGYRNVELAQKRYFEHLVKETGDDGEGNEWAWDAALEFYRYRTSPWHWLNAITEYDHGPELDALVDFIRECLHEGDR